jgi:transposase
MSREIRADYDQVLMFPPCVEDWVGEDHPARFIRDLVDSLDMKVLGFRVPDSDVGRPRYAPDLILKVWLYGYFNRIRSTRRLERACRENMGLIWLTGMKGPDHNSLWRFLDSNREAISQVFKQSVKVALKCDMVGMAIHAIDGTKISSNSSWNKMRTAEGLEKMQEKLDRSVADLMTEVERQEQEEFGQYQLPLGMHSTLARKDKIQKAFAELNESGVERVHHSEPEARLMKNRRNVDLSYNAQAVADQENGIVVAADVVNDCSDNGQLVPMLDLVKENLGAVAKENLADGGYFSGSQIGLAEEREYEVLLNPPSSESPRSSKKQVYHTKEFVYDKSRNCCICPHGEELPYAGKKKRGKNENLYYVYRCRKYRTCPYRSECTTSSKQGREVDISEHHEAIERQRAKRKQSEAKRLLSQRKVIIEPVFAWIKRQLGFTRWTVFGLEKVRTQWALICTTINLMKLYTRWKDGGLQLAA